MKEAYRKGLMVACVVLGSAFLVVLAYLPQADDVDTARTKDARLRVIKERFRSTWDAYRTNALGKDEIDPLTGQARDHVWGGWGVTLIDSLDTLYLMGMHDEFKEASHAVARVDFTRGEISSFFEVTIRNLGGLLSAYDLSQDKLFLDKARDLADVLLKAFESPSGLPYRAFDFKTQTPVQEPASSLADVGSCQLEFARLSQLTGDPRYRDTSFAVYYALAKATPEDGLYYTGVSVATGNFTNKSLSFGAKGDSFFEYLLKLNLLLPTGDPDAAKFLQMFKESIVQMKQLLVKPCHTDMACLGMTDTSGAFLPTTQHLNFFVPGMLLLADKHLPNQGWDALGLQLLNTFRAIPNRTATGLAPEVVQFSASAPMEVVSPYNSLRPELLESLFYAYRHTRDEKYRDEAWLLFTAFDRFCRSDFGYAEYNDVNSTDREVERRPHMPSYFLAETFKYLLLIFDDTLLPLDAWVLNTEAHPFKIPK